MSAAGLVRIISLLLTICVVASYGMFVYDELGSASKNQLAIASASGQPGVYERDIHGRIIKQSPSNVRARIDQVNDSVTSPGEMLGKHVSPAHNEWLLRTLSFAFGILVFTFGLGYLARWLETTNERGYTGHDPNTGYTAGSR